LRILQDETYNLKALRLSHCHTSVLFLQHRCTTVATRR